MSKEAVLINSDELVFGDNHTDAIESLNFNKSKYSLQVEHGVGYDEFSLAPCMEPMIDREVNWLIRAPITRYRHDLPGTIKSMTRLVNERSIIFQSIKSVDHNIADRLMSITPNIHVVLDILEGGEALGWKSAEVTLFNSELLDSLMKSSNEELSIIFRSLTNRELFALFNDVDAPSFPNKMYKRVSIVKQNELLKSHLFKLSPSQRTTVINRYLKSNFFRTTVSGSDVYIQRRDMPDSIDDDKIFEIQLYPLFEKTTEVGPMYYSAYFKVNDVSITGLPNIRWRKDHDGNKSFVFNKPHQQPMEAADRIVFRDDLLGAIVLANIVGLDSQKELILPEKHNSIKDHSFSMFSSGLMPFVVLYKEQHLLRSDFINRVESLV